MVSRRVLSTHTPGVFFAASFTLLPVSLVIFGAVSLFVALVIEFIFLHVVVFGVGLVVSVSAVLGFLAVVECCFSGFSGFHQPF